MEQEVLTLLDRLIRQPECVQFPSPVKVSPEEERRLGQELDVIMSQQPMGEENAKRTAYALAAARLNAIGSETMKPCGSKRLSPAGCRHTTC